MDLGSSTTSEVEQVLRFIYTGRYEVTAENVIHLAKAAKALKVAQLERICRKFIDKAIEPEKTCMSGLEPVVDTGPDSAVICVGDIRPKTEETEFFIQNSMNPPTPTGVKGIFLYLVDLSVETRRFKKKTFKK